MFWRTCLLIITIVSNIVIIIGNMITIVLWLSTFLYALLGSSRLVGFGVSSLLFSESRQPKRKALGLKIWVQEGAP